jgi:PAP2 superfamily
MRTFKGVAAHLAEQWVQTRFRILLSIIAFMQTLFIFMNPVGFAGLFGTPTCLFFTVSVFVLAYMSRAFNSSDASPDATPDNVTIHQQTVWYRIALIFMTLVLPGIFFGGVNIVCRALYDSQTDTRLYDDEFISMDTMLLGWLFPRGQLSLFLDTNPMIGPNALLGRIMNEVLQILYASYYIWGNAIGAYMLYSYARAVSYTRHQNSSSPPLEPNMRLDAHWRRLRIFTITWVGAYMLNFVLNLLFPAVSPRIALADEYQNPIQGFLVTNMIRDALTKAASNSYTAFPSGHCGISWTAALMATRLGYHRYARITWVAVVLITLATQVLRYHYFVDMVFAILLPLFGTILGGTALQRTTDAMIANQQTVV